MTTSDRRLSRGTLIQADLQIYTSHCPGGLGGLGSFLIMLADGVVKIVEMAKRGARNRMNVPQLDSSVLGMDMPLPDIDSDHQKKRYSTVQCTCKMEGKQQQKKGVLGS